MTTPADTEQDTLILDSLGRFLDREVKPHVHALEHDDIYGQIFALLVKTDLTAEPRYRGMSLFLAEKGPGFTVSKKLEKLGYKGLDSAELIFSDYEVAADRLIGGQQGRGLQHALSGLELGRINVAARGVGVAKAALDEAISYSQIRKP